MSEIAFEYLLSKIEATKGTAESTPDRWHILGGLLMPKNEIYTPEDRDGTLSMARRSVVVRECCWSGDLAAHAYSLDKAMKMYARIRSLDQVAAMLRE